MDAYARHQLDSATEQDRMLMAVDYLMTKQMPLHMKDAVEKGVNAALTTNGFANKLPNGRFRVLKRPEVKGGGLAALVTALGLLLLEYIKSGG